MEGDLDQLLAVAKSAHRVCLAAGADVVTIIKIGDSIADRPSPTKWQDAVGGLDRKRCYPHGPARTTLSPDIWNWPSGHLGMALLNGNSTLVAASAFSYRAGGRQPQDDLLPHVRQTLLENWLDCCWRYRRLRWR